MLYVFAAVISGAMISLQSTCNGAVYPFLGVLGVGFLSNLVNGVCAMLYKLAAARKLPSFRGLPFYYTFGGIFAVIVLGCNGLIVTRLGTAVTVCLSVSGQLFMSAICDHFGILGTEKRPFRLRRLPAFLCILAGVFTINSTGAGTFGDNVASGTLLPLLFFAIIIGCLTIFARLFNLKASQKIGRIDGTMANSFVGAGTALAVWLFAVRGKIPFGGFVQAPVPAFLTGFLGFIAGLINVTVYAKMNVFHTTILLLIGQIAAGILADMVLLGSLSAQKLAGIAVICAGIFLDKFLLSPDRPA